MHALFVDNLTVIDFAYFDPLRGIVGESLIMDVVLYGELNEEGMLFDFSYVKKRIKSCVDQLVDHKFLVARQQPGLNVVESPQSLKLDLLGSQGEKYQHISPPEAVYFVESDRVTPTSIEHSIINDIRQILPHNVNQLELKLRQETISGPYYHYAHGLKKHFGDCQRIAHGHRSKIEIWENGVQSTEWEQHLAKLWHDIYLATQEDIAATTTIEEVEYYVFQYHANQGMFKLEIPAARCQIIETDTTVELIADFIAKYLKQQKPQSKFRVKAYEGVDKGAIAEL